MTVHIEQIATDIVGELEKAWNAADGAAFARPFAADADFVNIRGEHARTREAIAKDTKPSSIPFTRAAPCACR